MGIFLRKSIKIFSGLRLNINTKGISFSSGVRNAKVNIGKRGTFLSMGIPGTGIYAREKILEKDFTLRSKKNVSQKATRTITRDILGNLVK